MAKTSAAGAPKREKKTRQQRLFEEAVLLFNKQGYAGTSIRDLADAVGILPGSVYAHIDGKHSVLVRLVEAGIDEYLAASKNLTGTAEQRLCTLIEAHVGVIAANIDQALVVFHQWRHIEGKDRQRILAKRRSYEKRIGGVVELGKRSGEFRSDLDNRVAVLAILGVLNWCPEWYSPRGRDSVSVVSKGLADVILAGVRSDSPPAIT
jgi:AcrR family transcriptional regulator